MKNCFPLSSRSLLYNEVDEDGNVNLIAELVPTVTQRTALHLSYQLFCICMYVKTF